ncbi:MAG: hypothetical protein ABIJ30_06795 [bacterium]
MDLALLLFSGRNSFYVTEVFKYRHYSAIVILSTFVATQAARIQNSGVRSQNENTCYDSFLRRYGDIEREIMGFIGLLWSYSEF